MLPHLNIHSVHISEEISSIRDPISQLPRVLGQIFSADYVWNNQVLLSWKHRKYSATIKSGILKKIQPAFEFQLDQWLAQG
jgi:hypothetical protein